MTSSVFFLTLISVKKYLEIAFEWLILCLELLLFCVLDSMGIPYWRQDRHKIMGDLSHSPGPESHQLSITMMFSGPVDSSFYMPNSLLLVIQALDNSHIVCPSVQLCLTNACCI